MQEPLQDNQIRARWDVRSAFTTSLFYFVAICLIFVGFRVAFHQTPEADGKTALYLFSAGAGVLLARELVYLLPKLIKLKVGNVELEIDKEVKDLKAQVQEIFEQLMEAQGVGTSAKQEETSLIREHKEI